MRLLRNLVKRLLRPRSSRRLLLIGPLLAVPIFFLDLITPLGYAIGVLYVFPVILVALTRSARAVLFMGLLGIALILLGYIFSPLSEQFSAFFPPLFNRIFSLGVVVGAMVMGLVLAHLLRRHRRVARVVLAANRARRENLEQMDLAARMASLGAWSLDADTQELALSPMVAELYNLPPGESLNLEAILHYYLPESRVRMRECLRQCLEEGLAFDEQFQLRLRDGTQRWARGMGRPIRNLKRHIVGVQGAFQNITRHKEMENMLVVSERRFQLLADAMPLIVWSADPEGRIDYFSRDLLVFTGQNNAEQLMGEGWLGVIHPDDRDSVVLRWKAAVEQGSPYRLEFRIRRYDGQYHWHLVHAEPALGSDGAIRKWFGSATNIDEQKRLQAETAALAHRLETTLESMTDAVYTVDRQWRVNFLNSQAERLLEKPSSELLGRSLWEAFPEARDTRFEERVWQAMKTGQPMEMEYYFPPLDRVFQVRAFPSDEGLAVYLQDISERRRLQQQLHQAQQLESLGQLTGGVAHDFNNLLTVIRGNAELLMKSLDDEQRLYALADMIGGAADRGAALTQRLLAFARRQALEPQTVDINTLVRGMDELLRRTLGSHVDVRLSLDERAWPTRVDPGQLESALLNLCINARDAMPEGGSLRIETANRVLDSQYVDAYPELEAGEYVTLAVSDTGEGMDERTLEQAFEPFFTTKEKSKGSGLGLSTTYGFIKQSRGHIRIHSEVGQGTTVRCYLPRDTKGDNEKQESKKMRASDDQGTETVLLVEDDDLVRRYATEQVKDLGYRVIEATDGPSAMEVLKNRDDIDLLFTDVVMPGGMSARELAAEAERLYPAIRVLYTSGYTDNAIVHHGRLEPDVLMLSKPYRREDLARMLRRALDRNGSD